MFSRVPITSNSNHYMATTIAPSTSTTNLPSLASTSISDVASDDPSVNLDWWSNAIEEDSFYSPLPFDASESGLWNGRKYIISIFCLRYLF